MTELQQNRYDQLLRRIGNLKGPGSKVNDVISELFPMIDVENVPGELLLLMGTRMCIGGGTLVSPAGQSPKMQLFNPFDSGNIITLTSFTVSSLASDTIRFGVTNLALVTAIGTETFRDMRLPLINRPVGEIRQENAVGFASGIGQFRNPNGTPLTFADPNGVAVLPPGTGFEVGLTARTVSIFTAFFWRERVAEPSELNL